MDPRSITKTRARDHARPHAAPTQAHTRNRAGRTTVAGDQRSRIAMPNAMRASRSAAKCGSHAAVEIPYATDAAETTSGGTMSTSAFRTQRGMRNRGYQMRLWRRAFAFCSCSPTARSRWRPASATPAEARGWACRRSAGRACVRTGPSVREPAARPVPRGGARQRGTDRSRHAGPCYGPARFGTARPTAPGRPLPSTAGKPTPAASQRPPNRQRTTESTSSRYSTVSQVAYPHDWQVSHPPLRVRRPPHWGQPVPAAGTPWVSTCPSRVPSR